MALIVCSSRSIISHGTLKTHHSLRRRGVLQTSSKNVIVGPSGVWALAYPRTLPKQSSTVQPRAILVQESARQSVPEYHVNEHAVIYLGSDADVAGRTLFLHLRPGTTVGQVVVICNELSGRVQDGQRQRFKGTTRPVSFTTPSARVDWDPAHEELPEHMGTLLGAEVHSLKLRMISVTVDSRAELNCLREHLSDTVHYIENIDFDRIPLSGSI